jgi:hypothetical protein
MGFVDFCEKPIKRMTVKNCVLQQNILILSHLKDGISSRGQ